MKTGLSLRSAVGCHSRVIADVVSGQSATSTARIEQNETSAGDKEMCHDVCALPA